MESRDHQAIIFFPQYLAPYRAKPPYRCGVLCVSLNDSLVLGNMGLFESLPDGYTW